MWHRTVLSSWTDAQHTSPLTHQYFTASSTLSIFAGWQYSAVLHIIQYFMTFFVSILLKMYRHDLSPVSSLWSELTTSCDWRHRNKQTNKHVQPKTEPRLLLICTPFVLEAVVTSKSGHVCDVCIVFRRSTECTFSPQLVTSTSGRFKYLCVPAAVMPGISHQLFVSIMLH